MKKRVNYLGMQLLELLLVESQHFVDPLLVFELKVTRSHRGTNQGESGTMYDGVVGGPIDPPFFLLSIFSRIEVSPPNTARNHEMGSLEVVGLRAGICPPCRRRGVGISRS